MCLVIMLLLIGNIVLVMNEVLFEVRKSSVLMMFVGWLLCLRGCIGVNCGSVVVIFLDDMNVL